MLNLSKIIDRVGLDSSDTDYQEPLDVLIRSINKEANLTFLGNLAVEYQIKEHLWNRSLISQAYNDVNSENVSQPIIVIGLPRSGTTFLFNLLSKDLDNRSPLFWEMMKPLPLVTPGSFSEKSRIFRSDSILFLKERFIPQLDNIHAIRSESPEECLLIKVFALQSIFYFYMANTPSYLEYLINADTGISYDWHYKFLKVLEKTRKPKRWLLKDPSHLGNLKEILDRYPDACFIHITRDPSETLPSICSLTSQVRRGFSNHLDSDDLGRRTLDFWAKSNDKNESQISMIPAKNYLQVEYDDLLEDPINLMRDMYSKFSLPLNDLPLNQMINFVETGKQEAKMKHNYSLEDYGLDKKEVHNKLNFR
jgi:hypothetical protein